LPAPPPFPRLIASVPYELIWEALITFLKAELEQARSRLQVALGVS